VSREEERKKNRGKGMGDERRGRDERKRGEPHEMRRGPYCESQ